MESSRLYRATTVCATITLRSFRSHIIPNRIFYDLTLIKMSPQSRQTSANTTNCFFKDCSTHVQPPLRLLTPRQPLRSCRRTEIASVALRAQTPLLNTSSEVLYIYHPTIGETTGFHSEANLWLLFFTSIGRLCHLEFYVIFDC